MEGFLSLFGGASTTTGTAATSAATTAAENAALAQSGATAASVTAAGQASIASQAGTFAGLTAAQWANIGSNVLQTGSQIGQNISSADQAKTLAQAALAESREKVFMDERRSKSLIAKQKAGGAAAGLLGTGTPDVLLKDSAYNAMLNSINIRTQGRFNADYYKTQARRSKAQIPGLIFGGLLKGYGDYAKLKGP